MSDTKNTVDLNIDNYDLDDILALFRIPKDFNESQLKSAKQIVLKTHPDKSRLPPEYFIFYSKAYKTLFSVWEFRKKGDIDKNNTNTEYSKLVEEDRTKLLDNYFDTNKQFKKEGAFNKWFNEQFEINRIESETDGKGYGDWLKTDEDLEPLQHSSMKEEFDRRKTQMRSLIVHEDIQELYSNNSISAGELSTGAPTSFNSDIFSNLPYQDLHQAHTETVIPVTDEDYAMRPKFNNVNEFMTFRGKQDTKPLSEQQALQYLNNKNKKEDELAVRRAYDLAKQMEMARQKNQEFWAGIQMLK